LARQMLEAEAAAISADQLVPDSELTVLANRLSANVHLLIHCHALALEHQLASRVEARSGVDPVLSPLLQALIASDDAATAAGAMSALAAQARFMQQQRRMELPLAELPADLFHFALTTWRGQRATDNAETSTAAELALRSQYDEGAGRLGQMHRLVSGMGTGIPVALSLSHAGVALFLTALAVTSQQDRDLTAISTNESQFARLALGLCAARLKPKDVEEQFLYIHPDVALPDGFDQLRADRASGLLALSGRRVAG
jgi:hypothetical protein